MGASATADGSDPQKPVGGDAPRVFDPTKFLQQQSEPTFCIFAFTSFV